MLECRSEHALPFVADDAFEAGGKNTSDRQYAISRRWGRRVHDDAIE
jgi:hypothetical protein